jgi:hypothetical protein
METVRDDVIGGDFGKAGLDESDVEKRSSITERGVKVLIEN